MTLGHRGSPSSRLEVVKEALLFPLLSHRSDNCRTNPTAILGIVCFNPPGNHSLSTEAPPTTGRQGSDSLSLFAENVDKSRVDSLGEFGIFLKGPHRS
jgi:hypothetical protein